MFYFGNSSHPPIHPTIQQWIEEKIERHHLWTNLNLHYFVSEVFISFLWLFEGSGKAPRELERFFFQFLFLIPLRKFFLLLFRCFCDVLRIFQTITNGICLILPTISIKFSFKTIHLDQALRTHVSAHVTIPAMICMENCFVKLSIHSMRGENWCASVSEKCTFIVWESILGWYV